MKKCIVTDNYGNVVGEYRNERVARRAIVDRLVASYKAVQFTEMDLEIFVYEGLDCFTFINE